jgi:pimeloyl-ACP methyl ester carboxylesterase
MKSPLNLRKRAVRLAVGGAALAVAAAIVPATTAFAAKGAAQLLRLRPTRRAKPTVVLVPGAWADGSSWDGVVADLQHDGYTVDVPPNPLEGVASDSAYLASYLATITGPIVLVGQSYGGFVITNAATGNTNIKALVYVDAFIPAQGETLNQLTDQFPGSQVAQAALNFVPEPGGVTDVYIKPADFRAILANDLARPGRRTRRHPAPDRRRRARRALRHPGLAHHPELGRDRHRGPRRARRRPGIHGPPRRIHRHGDRRRALLHDLPPEPGHRRHRDRGTPHLLNLPTEAGYFTVRVPCMYWWMSQM